MAKQPSNKLEWLRAVKNSLGEVLEQDFYENLVEIVDVLRRQKKSAFNRFLPLGEYFGDRWARALEYGFGKGSSIYDSAVVIGDVQVGVDTWIGPNTLLDGSGGLTIGSNCSISAGVQVYSHDSVDWAISGGSASYKYTNTRIGDNTYIGPNSIISKGVTIGSGCIIGAQSFVNSDVADGQRVAGTPAKILMSRKAKE
jgi:acetyltransferase-like isoleucine patch superfamily enzyme